MKRISLLICCLQVGWLFGQVENSSLPKHSNSFGISVELGGGLELANDITTVHSDESSGMIVETKKKSNIGGSLFWEHHWNFHNNHGLLFGVGGSFTSFYYGVRFKNPEVSGVPNETKEYLLGGFRSGFASVDFPLCYTYSFETKAGTFSPFVGVNLKNVSYLIGAGRNEGGIISTTEEINQGDTTYYNEYGFTFGTKSITPVLMPVVGLKYSRGLQNGGKLNFHLNYKFFFRNSNTVEAYLNDFDNQENGVQYMYFDKAYPVTYDPTTNTYSGVKQSIYTSLDLSSLNIGVSYTLKQ